MKIGPVIVERKTDAELNAEKQEHISAIRKGGFTRTAARAQAKLDRKSR
jgi:hypothetical protein